MTSEKKILPSDKKRKRLIRIKAKTNPNYGKKPDEQSVKELLCNGVINLDKPEGPTSHQVDAWIKKILNEEKIGHGGTLDPNATGVLPIAIADATKVLPALLPAGKEYVAIMNLHKKTESKNIKKTCEKMVGEITQLPPVRSAVKRVHRKRHIYYFDIIEIENIKVLFRVGCESGTYVRTLCVDIGKKLKTGAHLSELRRTRVGHLREEDSVNLQDLKDAYTFWREDKEEKSIRKIIKPMEYFLKHLPKIIIRDSAVDAICHGANLALPGVAELDTDIKKDQLIAVMTIKGEAVALMNTLMTTEEIIQKEKGFCAKTERVLMKKNTYPSIWKKN